MLHTLFFLPGLNNKMKGRCLKSLQQLPWSPPLTNSKGFSKAFVSLADLGCLNNCLANLNKSSWEMQRSSQLSQPSSLLFCYCFSLRRISKPANIHWQKSWHVFACVCINLHASGRMPAKACVFLLLRVVLTSPELSDNCISELVLRVKTKWTIKS